MQTYHFVITRNSEQERTKVRAPDEALAWKWLVSAMDANNVEKIALTTIEG